MRFFFNSRTFEEEKLVILDAQRFEIRIKKKNAYDEKSTVRLKNAPTRVIETPHKITAAIRPSLLLELLVIIIILVY